MTAEQPKTLDTRAAEILAAGQAKDLQEAKLLARKEQLQAEVDRTKKNISDYRAKLRKKAAVRRRKREARGKIVLGAAVLKAGLAKIDYESEDEKQIIRFMYGYDESRLIKALQTIASSQAIHVVNVGMSIINSLKRDATDNLILHEKGFPTIVVTDSVIKALNEYHSSLQTTIQES
jgi:hypothetical protein